jgi:hypothetical protein
MLPDFSELRITFVEQPSATETKLELHWLPIVGWFRDVKYYVPSLPDEPRILYKLLDSWIYECLYFFCEKESENLKVLDAVLSEISKNSDPFAIVPIKSKRYKTLDVSLGLRYGGPHDGGGELFLTVTKLVSGESVQRKLFDFVWDWHAFGLCSKISVVKDILTIEARQRWVTHYPELPHKISISLSELFRTDDESKWIVSDVSAIRKRLARVL